MSQKYGLNSVIKQRQIEQLQELWGSAHWPYLPSDNGELYNAACDLMIIDTYVAGCFQRIIDFGTLPEEYYHILVVDDSLTSRLGASHRRGKIKNKV